MTNKLFGTESKNKEINNKPLEENDPLVYFYAKPDQ